MKRIPATEREKKIRKVRKEQQPKVDRLIYFWKNGSTSVVPVGYDWGKDAEFLDKNQKPIRFFDTYRKICKVAESLEICQPVEVP